MRQLVVLFALTTSLTTLQAQDEISPANNPFNNTYVADETYTLKWYMVQDTLKHELGEVTTTIQPIGDKITFITQVKLKQATAAWVDSTIVNLKDFSPIYHASYNQNRDMAMEYGDAIIGFYQDKKSGERTELNHPKVTSVFDSSSYSQLVRWLPLEEGYTTILSIFDFNPNAHTGEMKATIQNVTSERLESKDGVKNVWKVHLKDDITNNQADNYLYIDQSSRKLLKQEVVLPGRKMLMERVEE